jgi:hypothetical protein
LPREDVRSNVVQAVTGRELQGRRGEVGRGFAFVGRSQRRLRVEQRETACLPPELDVALSARVVLKEAKRDQRGDDARDRDSEEEEGRKPDS